MDDEDHNDRGQGDALTLHVGMQIAHGDHHFELERALTADGGAWLARDLRRDRARWLWRAPWREGASWSALLTSLLKPSQAPPGLPELCQIFSLNDGSTFALLSPPSQLSSPEALRECDSSLFESLDLLDGLSSIKALVELLGELEARDVSLGGLSRAHLLWDEARASFVIAAMPHLRRWKRGVEEELWRDTRLIGELMFELFMGRSSPGGHELAALLQDSQRMFEVGLRQPGLAQILAGCVTPYGDLAYADHAQLLASLCHLEAELARPLDYLVASRSTVGVSIFRKNNQDACAHLKVQDRCGSLARRALFACVADGIGGIHDGERASASAARTGCEMFARAWARVGVPGLQQQPTDFARGIAKIVSQRLALEGEFLPESNRGGTTCSSVLLAGDRLGLAHVGDSRVYLIRAQALYQLTTDHTLATILDQLGERGRLDPKPQSVRERTISRFLTTSMELPLARIDSFCPEALEALKLDEFEPLSAGIALYAGDRLLLVSDGVSPSLSPETLLSMSRQSATPEAFVDALTRRSLDALSRDNVTALAIDVVAGRAKL